MPVASAPASVALDELARLHAASLHAFALKICRDESQARDLVQDTMERALRSFHTLTPGTNARAWLFTILHNLFIDACRKARREPRSSAIEEIDLPQPEPAEVPAWTSISREQLTAAVSELDEEFRVVYRMHAIESRSYADIASTLGVPASTVGTRLARARRKLRAILERAASEGAP